MNKIIFDIQRFAKDNSGETGIDALELMHSIIERFDLKKDGNSTLKFIGTFWGSLFFKKSSGQTTLEVSSLTTMLAGTVSIIEDVYAIREEKAKDNPSEVVITAKAEDLISNFTSLTNAFQKLASGKNSFILSIVSSAIGLTANLVLGMDGLKEDEKEKINKSYVALLQVSGAEIIKKFFSEGLADNILKLPINQILDNPAVKAEIRKQTATNFTKGSGPLGLIFAAITGVLNGANEYDSRIKKYSDDGIPEDITKHDALIDAIATFIHDTASYYAKGFDDTVFKWIQSLISAITGKESLYYNDKNYVEVIADAFKTLNVKNSGTSGDDNPLYALEDKVMIYGDGGNDHIENFAFSNVTIWGGHDHDTIYNFPERTYSGEISSRPLRNSIFGGPGEDNIAVYDKQSTIYGGADNDSILVLGTNNIIYGNVGKDSIYLHKDANSNTAIGGLGNDFIFLFEETKNAVISYSQGDGNDTIQGLNEDDEITIKGGTYSTLKSEGNIKIIISKGSSLEGSILLLGAEGKKIKINGKTIGGGQNDTESNSGTHTFIPIEFPPLPTIPASPIIRGSEENDRITNEEDNVIISARNGNDSIYNGSDESKAVLYYGGSNVTINGGSGNDRIINRTFFNKEFECGIKVEINGDTGDDQIYNIGDNFYEYGLSNHYDSDVTIKGGDGNDKIYNYIALVTINANEGNDSIDNMGNKVTIDSGDGNDYICNGHTEYWAGGNQALINGGNDNDKIYNYGYNVTINADDGDDQIYNYREHVTINANEGDDYIENTGQYDLVIDGGDGNDSIISNITNKGTGSSFNDHISNLTIEGGMGDDIISLEGDFGYSSLESNLIIYKEGDGNDTIFGFDNYSTLSVSGGSYSTQISGDDFIIVVGDSSISLIDAAVSWRRIQIDGEEEIKLTFNDNSNSVIMFGEKTEIGDASTRTKAIQIIGNYLDNSIVGGTANDTIDGDKGNDSLSGGDGNDYLLGDTGTNVLLGEAGNDTITNYGYSSTISGGDGDDSIWSHGSNVIIDGDNGNDFITNESIEGSHTIKSSNIITYENTIKADNVTIGGGVGDDSIYNNGENVVFKYSSGDGNDFIQGFNESSTLQILSGSIDRAIINDSDLLLTIGEGTLTIENVSHLTQVNVIDKNGTNIEWELSGTTGDDSISNNFNNISINAFNGNDTIENYGTSVAINGGVGNDYIYNTRRKSSIDGNDGNDTITNDGYYSIIDGGAGNDSIENDGFYATIKAGTGDDTISLKFEYSPDYNLIQYDLGDGNDTITGLSRHDTLSISGSPYSTQKNGSDIIVIVGDNKINLIDAANLWSINIDGTLTVNTTLEDTTSTDTVPANEILTIDKNETFVTLDSHFKFVDASKHPRTIQITGNDLDNSIIGGMSSDTIWGNSGKNTLTGGKGKDIFVHGGGNDLITDYEKGKDKISLDSALISDFIVDNKNLILASDDNTSLTINNAANKQISFLNASKTTKIVFTSNASLDGSEKGATLTSSATEFSAANYSKIVTINAESVSSAVSITGNSKANRIIAGNNGSTLNGGKGKDTLFGGKGTDIFVYNNKSGNKVIQNYSSDDIISLTGAQIADAYVKSNDVILKAGNKKITVKDAANKDIIISEDGSTKFFSAGIIYDQNKTSATLPPKFSSKAEKIFDDTVTEIDASDARKKLALTSSNTTGTTIYGGRGKDSLTGNSGNDIIYGGKGKDSLYGNAGDDSLIGDKGNDKLFGGTGADSLWGGKGNDTLYGDDGSDTFLYSKGDGKDVIFNFSDDDLLQVNGTFSAYYNSNKNEVSFKVASTSNAITLKDFSASSFSVNGNSYKISGNTLIKK